VNLATIPTPVPEATATPSPYKTLKKGMKNNKQVKNLQDRLYKLGWFNGVRDGDFGPATQTAVKKFQKALGLPEAEQDGIATSALQEQLYADNAPRGDGKAPSATTAPDATPAPEGGETPNT
jgi:peptidoglycan hydrolase-like protein with peptidoglycan-binding domain